VALEHFGIVPDTPNDADHPISAKARRFTKVPLGSHEPHDLGLFGVHGLRVELVPTLPPALKAIDIFALSSGSSVMPPPSNADVSSHGDPG